VVRTLWQEHFEDHLPGDPAPTKLHGWLAGDDRDPPEAAALLGQLRARVLPRVVAACRQKALAAGAAGAALQAGRAAERAHALATRPCAHLGCTSVAAFGLPDHKRMKCSGCRVVRYCGAACQRADWRAHKPACAALQQQAAEKAGQG
jgi:hypothetical protein